MRQLRLGTRGSALALVQSRKVASDLQLAIPDLRVELVLIKTSGDLNQRDPLAQIGGKGVFVKELEQALLAGEIDFAVHSLKDMPARLPDGLHLSQPPTRADARDALVGPVELSEVKPGLRVGTGSLRRQAQLRLLRPDLLFSDIRGNVPTRVEKWRQGEFPGGVILACAGLTRLGSDSGAAPEEIHPLSPEECLPSPCQGILGLEFGRPEVGEMLNQLAVLESAWMMQAERAFLVALGGDCNLPAGGLASVTGTRLTFRANLWRDDNLKACQLEGDADQAEELGRRAAAQLLS